MKLSLPTLFAALLASSTLVAPAAWADTATPVAKRAIKQKSHAKKAIPAQFDLAAPDDDDTGSAIDPKHSLTTDYQCELGATVTIFRNEGDDQHIALQHDKLITRMQRVGTTTGANRFENKRSGLVWIGIPAKGILLDGRHGHQLANDCKDADQQHPKPQVAAVPKIDEAAKPAAVEAPAKSASATADVNTSAK